MTVLVPGEVNKKILKILSILSEDECAMRFFSVEISNSDLVAVKRKVFGKKNRETVLDAVFAFKGRLYFRKRDDRRVEVVAIGTKNTQELELEFLSSF